MVDEEEEKLYIKFIFQYLGFKQFDTYNGIFIKQKKVY
jgi:hypothetical protein